MKLSVYHDSDVGFPVKREKCSTRTERWSWVEDAETLPLDSPIGVVTRLPWPLSARVSTSPPPTSTSRLPPVLSSNPHLATSPIAPLKTWVRHVHAFCESETMLLLQEETLDYKNGKALGALNSTRVMAHNVFGFTGRRADQAKTSMYLYQMTLVHVARTSRRRLEDAMDDEVFHLALITVCLEVCAFVYRQDDGRFSPGFPVLTNTVQQGNNLPEILACLDWFSQCFNSYGGPLVMPTSLQDYIDAISDAVVDRGLFGDADRQLGAQAVPLLAPGRPTSLISYCLRHILVYLHAKIEHVILQAWDVERNRDDTEDNRKASNEAGHVGQRDHFIRQSNHMVDILIRQRMDLLFGSTCSLTVVCCAFCSGKVWKKNLGFGALCLAAGISSTSGRLSAHTFYNEVFLPSVLEFELDELDFDVPRVTA